MRKQISKSVSAALILAFVAFMSSCNNRQQSSDKVNKKEVEKDVKEVVYPMPTSFELTEMLNRIGAAYILTLSNSAENVNKYLTERSQALNLGVYGADLCYASTYRQQKETMSYMKASKVLVEGLNISSAIDPDIIDKIEQSGDNKEKLVKIITESFYSTYKYLQKNDRSGVSTIIMAGSWVEGLYIATHISEDTYKNVEMVKIILDQKKSLDKLLGLMAKNTNNADVKSAYDDLQPLKKIYDSIDEKAITEKQLNSIQSAVSELRNKIVE
ncbi:MAG: hypothetical protein Q8909_06510 [Bacteroidota bacterium]|uniref:hypothetical protein n=1 Tax=Parabacteroides sp. FAFU027 TaxID=2922715 RepID=UPI001FAF62B0|nr:hypothetical protein [Parabacteroides sp. FAFU027]MDP4269760.1 hypothetical protein [Bacteroidota bacterium]